MGDLLFGFVYRTLITRANDPTNARCFLPPRLAAADHPDRPGRLLPLREKDWPVGELGGAGGRTIRQGFAESWMTIVERELWQATPPVDTSDLIPVPCPDRAWPQMDLPTVTVAGLDNVFGGPDPERSQPPSGYHAVLTFEFGRHPDRERVSFAGDYVLTQCVCAVEEETGVLTDRAATIPPMSWPSQRLRGSGTFRAAVSGMVADVTVDVVVTGAGAERRLAATIAGITLRGPKRGAMPRVVVDPKALTLAETENDVLRGMFLSQAAAAFNSPEAGATLFTQTNATLAAPPLRAALGRMLTRYLNDTVDGLFGPPAGGLPSGQGAVNPVDQYLFDRFRAAVNTPGSPAHLPAAVLRMSDPVLDPYLADTLPLGSVPVPGMDGVALEDLTLSALRVTGLSNLTAPPAGLRVEPGKLYATLHLSRIATPTTATVTRAGAPVDVPVPLGPLRASGWFGCHFAGDTDQLAGELTLEVTGATLVVEAALDGADLEHLDLRITRLRVHAPPDAVTLRLVANANLADVVEAAMNTSAVKLTVLDRLNDQLASRLDEISKALVASLQKIVGSELGG